MPLPVGSELFREAIDAFALLANADTGFHQIKAWSVLKLDLYMMITCAKIEILLFVSKQDAIPREICNPLRHNTLLKVKL